MSETAKTANGVNRTAELLREEARNHQGSGALAAWVRAWLVRRRTFLMLITALVMLGIARPRPELFWWGVGLLAAADVVRLLCSGYINKAGALVTNGPFACCRNPLYLTNLAVGLGFVLMCARWEALVLIVVGWFATHLPTVACEERLLGERFGEDFEKYCGLVPRWLPCWPKRGVGKGQRFDWRKVIHNHEHLNVVSAWLLAAMFYIELVK